MHKFVLIVFFYFCSNIYLSLKLYCTTLNKLLAVIISYREASGCRKYFLQNQFDPMYRQTGVVHLFSQQSCAMHMLYSHNSLDGGIVYDTITQ